MIKETIKWIEGYEDLYFIDKYLNIVSCPKINGRYFVNSYRVLTPTISNSGYLHVSLTNKDGVMKSYNIHRLIANAFIENPKNLPCVNHINGIKTDNRICNLEWTTVSENTKHAYENNLGGMKDSSDNNLKKINDRKRYKKIVVIKDDKEFIFDSLTKAASFIGSHRDNVSFAIRKGKNVNGFRVFGEK